MGDARAQDGSVGSVASIASAVAKVVIEYARFDPEADDGRPLHPGLSLRADLGIESLALASVVLRLQDDLDLDLIGSGADLTGLDTLADLLGLIQRSQRSSFEQQGEHS